MVENVIFTPQAEDDVSAAHAWYEEREPGLGEDFLRCVEDRLPSDLELQAHRKRTNYQAT